MPLILNNSLTFRLFYKKKRCFVVCSFIIIKFSLFSKPGPLCFENYIKPIFWFHQISFTLNLYSHFQTLMIKSHVTSFKFKFIWIMHGGKSNVLTLEFKVNFKSNLFLVFYTMMHVELCRIGTKKSRNLIKIGIWVIFMTHIFTAYSMQHIVCASK